MKRLLATILGVSCCASVVYAQSPRIDLNRNPFPAFLVGGQNSPQSYSTSSMEQQIQFLNQETRPKDTLQELSQLAYKISYFSSLILTADQIVRSVDSVMDRMELTREDGARLRLRMQPGSNGFEVMLKMSRPIDF